MSNSHDAATRPQVSQSKEELRSEIAELERKLADAKSKLSVQDGGVLEEQQQIQLSGAITRMNSKYSEYGYNIRPFQLIWLDE